VETGFGRTTAHQGPDGECVWVHTNHPHGYICFRPVALIAEADSGTRDRTPRTPPVSLAGAGGVLARQASENGSAAGGETLLVVARHVVLRVDARQVDGLEPFHCRSVEDIAVVVEP
jgi:hypothetical protein